ncbi:hypothetical protein GCM10009504_40470 [Pseudomonas laurentiana]|uniref:DUF3850 domain-containing protein n=1 Tax=Pseudomonas laurentiana TaxID=2364649 RepID=UPI00167AAFE6|nr:DUF3850 domain-containing protein [Pseudomonas laurentiana]GGU79477.1 hypothetical protein GCM10009504_40470 [Pseudomonas laurentiana]
MPTENRYSNTEVAGGPREHELKIHTVPLNDLLSGAKTGEIRDCYDRDFAVGDTVLLREVAEDRSYTGRTARRTITHVQKHYGLPDHLCVLSYGKPAEQHQGEPVALPSCKAKLSMSHDWDQGHSDGWKDCLEEISKLGPLYTHADSDSLQRSWQAGYDTAWYAKNPAEKRTSVNPADAGELELARKMLRSVRRREEKWALLCGGRNNQIATLRAKLAEQEHSARELLRIIGMSVQGSAAYNRAVVAFHDSLNADTKPN